MVVEAHSNELDEKEAMNAYAFATALTKKNYAEGNVWKC